MSSAAEVDEFLMELEDEALEVQQRVEGPALDRSGQPGELVQGGVQWPDQLKKSKVNVNSGEYVGSVELINAADGDVAVFNEWKHSTEAQRDIVAQNLVTMSFHSVEWNKFPRMFLCQITRMRGVMEWVLVPDATIANKIASAILSRVRNQSVLLWCEDKVVRYAAKRFLNKRGVCAAWGVFNPETHEPPRWPCRRGESCFEGAEVVKRFVEKLKEWKESKRGLPRIGELEGLLDAVKDGWESEQVWSVVRKTTVPEWPVFFPSKLWGCPLRSCFQPPAAVAAREAASAAEASLMEAEAATVPQGPVLEGPAFREDIVVARSGSGEQEQEQEQGQEEEGDGRVLTEKERRKKEKNRRHHLAQRAKERAKREEKRAKEEA